MCAGIFEKVSQVGFRSSIILIHNFGAINMDKVGAGFMGYGASNQRFPATGGAMQQHTFGRVDTQALENFWIAHGQFNHFTNAAHNAFQPADIFVSDGAAFRTGGAFLAGCGDTDDGRRANQDRARRDCLCDGKSLGAGAEQIHAHLIPGNNRNAIHQARQVTAFCHFAPMLGGAFLARGGGTWLGLGRNQYNVARWLNNHPPHADTVIQTRLRVGA